MMAGPLWARWLFALLFAAIGIYCMVRLLLVRRTSPAGRTADDTAADFAHLLMSSGMIVMFAPIPIPTPLPPGLWSVGFGAHSAWLLGSRVLWPFRTEAAGLAGLRGKPHLITHVVAGAVMAYAFAIMPADMLATSGQSHLAHQSESSVVFPVVGWLATAYFFGHAMRCGIHVAVPEPMRRRVGVHGPEASMRMVMGLGMSYMLLTML
jgi:hypothetical protein